MNATTLLLQLSTQLPKRSGIRRYIGQRSPHVSGVKPLAYRQVQSTRHAYDGMHDWDAMAT